MCFTKTMSGLLVLGTFFSAVLMANQEPSTITVIDDTGVSVVLSQPAKRLVVLGPNLIESLYEIGAGDTILGASEYSDYPEAAKSIPRVGSHNTINFEMIVSMAPDLVLIWHSGFGAEHVAKLRSLGLAVYASEPKTLDDIELLLNDLGQLTGLSNNATIAADQFRSEFNYLQNRYSQKETVSVFYQVWHEPMQTLNGDHVVNAVIELCGGQNVFASLSEIAPRVSVESVIAMNPDVIVSSGSDNRDARELDFWQRWPMINAVHNEQVYFIKADSLVRHAPRILQGAQQLCDLLERSRSAQKNKVQPNE
ncbi:cobalamin-binding protein [Pseudomonadales bacterium]|nr:cobalamin-binding protein [Pseudomonadales bacterium]